MAEWPASGVTDWNTKMLAYLAVGHNTDGTHNQEDWTPATQAGSDDSIGEIAFPNGFQMKWGDKTVAGHAAQAVDFTTEGLTDFDNAIFQAYVTSTTGVDGDFGMAITAIATTGITIHNNDGQLFKGRWFAIGR